MYANRFYDLTGHIKSCVMDFGHFLPAVCLVKRTRPTHTQSKSQGTWQDKFIDKNIDNSFKKK